MKISQMSINSKDNKNTSEQQHTIIAHTISIYILYTYLNAFLKQLYNTYQHIHKQQQKHLTLL